MGKILYPVGTKVIVVKDIGFPGNDSIIGRTAEVIGYTKKSDNPRVCNGEPLPYRIKMQNGWITNASVNELKRYNPTQAKATQTGSDVASPKQVSPVTHDVYTKEEVDTLLAQQYQDLLTLLEIVDETAFNAFQKSNRIAEVVEANFRKVAKQFKTLNHDDD